MCGGIHLSDWPMTVVHLPVVLEGLVKDNRGTARKRRDFLKITQFCFPSSSEAIILVGMNVLLLGLACVHPGPNLLKALSNSSYRRQGSLNRGSSGGWISAVFVA